MPVTHRYTSLAAVREATGMNDSSLISDALIDSKISGAEGTIDGLIGDAYVLPLPDGFKCEYLNYLATELSVAMLFIDQYGDDGKDGDKGWKKRMDALLSEDPKALGLIVKIQQGKLKLRDDSTSIEFPRSTLRSPAFFPNDVSSDPGAANSTAPQQTMSKKF